MAAEAAPVVFIGGPRSTVIERAVCEGGGRITTDPATADAVVWLSKEITGLRDVLHDRIRWVQLPDAGVEKWINGGLIDDRRAYTSARGCYGRQVAEHALALLFACARGLGGYARQSSWERPARAGGVLVTGAEVLVVGAGDIGSRLIESVTALGARAVAVTRTGRSVPGATRSWRADELHDALPTADFVVICAPSTRSTRHLFGTAQLARMKRSSYLINVARGDLVDSTALADAVRDGVIAGAGLDVVDPEPLPADSPLWRLPGVLITPHVANPAAVKEAALGRRVLANTTRFAAGRELVGRIEVSRGY